MYIRENYTRSMAWVRTKQKKLKQAFFFKFVMFILFNTDTCFAFSQLQAHPVFARFNHSIRPNAIPIPHIPANLRGNVVAFAAKLEHLVLNSISASQIQQHEQKEILTEIKGDEEPHSIKAAEKSTHKATMLESDTKASY
jgi:hypothetical protein